jgi:hypothetical protein
MKNLYIISISDSQGRMQSYRIAAPTKLLAEAEACRLAGVAPDTEPATFQNTGRIDSEVG